MLILLGAAFAAQPAAAGGPRGLSTVKLKRVGAAAVAGARVRLQVAARVRRGRVIARHTVSYGDGTKLRRGVRRPRELRHVYRRAGRYRVTLTLIDNRRRRTVGRLWIAVRSAPAPAPPPAAAPALATPPPPPFPPSKHVTVPASIPADCSAPVQEQLASFVDAQPDGGTIEFPAGGCYAQDDRIVVREKRDLTIDANGSTFRSSAPNTGGPDRRQLDRPARHERAADRHADRRQLPSDRRPLAAARQRRHDRADPASQFNMGVGIYGGTGIHVTDTTIEHVFGDGVAVNMAHYVDGSAAHPLDAPSDVHVARVHTHTAARHCYSPSAADGFWLEDSTAARLLVRRAGRRAGQPVAAAQEPAHPAQHVRRLLHVRRHRPGRGRRRQRPRTSRSATTRSRRDPTTSATPTIDVGLYPSSDTNTIKNVVVAGNALAARSGLGVRFDHVEGGAITDNRSAGYHEAGCSYPAATPFSRLTNSTGVTVAANDQSP